MIYDSGEVSLEHLLLSWYPSQSQPTLTINFVERSQGVIDSGLVRSHEDMWSCVCRTLAKLFEDAGENSRHPKP